MSTKSTREPKRRKTSDAANEQEASAPKEDEDVAVEATAPRPRRTRASKTTEEERKEKEQEGKGEEQDDQEDEQQEKKKKTIKKKDKNEGEESGGNEAEKKKDTSEKSEPGSDDMEEDGEDEEDIVAVVGAKSIDGDDENDEDYNDGDARMDEEAEADVDDEEDDADGDDDDDDEEEEEEEFELERKRSKRGSKKQKKKEDLLSARRSSRANKFSGSLRDEPVKPPPRLPDDGDSDDKIYSTRRRDGKTSKKSRKRSKPEDDDDDEASSETEEGDNEMEADEEEESNDSDSKERRGSNKRSRSRDNTGNRAKHVKKSRSSSKSSSRKNSRPERKKRGVVAAVSDSEDSLERDEDEETEDTTPDDDDEDDYQVQRIIASRSETRGKWRDIMEKMNTTEITNGTRFPTEARKKDEESEKDDIFVERFLVKWANYSFLHCSWELEEDLKNYVDDAKNRLTTFFRKSENGYLFDADERADGDYFNPAFVQVERILEMEDEDPKEQKKKPASRRKGKRRRDDESTKTKATQEAGEPSSDPRPQIITDPDDPNYDSGMGRQLLVKWGDSPYVDSTYEYERDLILQNVEYEDQLTEFLRRSIKPNKANMKDRYVIEAKGTKQLKQMFADNEGKEARIEAFQKELEDMTFDNGGQLRNYQAEGVSWLLSNHINGRSSILADEMGLGKTIQTACYISFLAQKLSIRGPYLIVAPLSTLVHWKRELSEWTNFNSIVYHGTAEDRDLIRQYEMAYPKDRPENHRRTQHFLKRCHKPKALKWEKTWMAEVVITSPEMLVTDDHKELTFVEWEVLVVDEAHRLKNKGSKLGRNLTQSNFIFRQVVFLTGTPIQNNMTEMWTLLNLIDGTEFSDLEQFLEEYGDIKSKEKLDELHERIRPYILRRLKEDVEKSVPPKEETVIEVELTVLQKQYYRALYERNVQFLHRNKRKALDGPSLSNLAMQLRKCCNHPFLLKGVEEDVREQTLRGGNEIDEAELLVKSSGKLVLLEKLLPRLKKDGHRVLIFSQFKIMLDVIEDYLRLRNYRSERIDGSITGRARQQAIDKFQLTPEDSEDAPFIMLLSTRAGGQGITLTRADTCLLFDSDYNPQNDLQAQARCHRIGQTKDVKVYRLLSRKTYEMQMFHMSSLKMGLDQAVLNGIENGQNTGSGALTKEEVENLLRHGAYDIFAEERNGTSEKESNAFVAQDIDDIMARRTKTIVHEQANKGGGSSTFSKATFKAGDNTSSSADIDMDDPEFWTKVVGEKEQTTSLSPMKKRTRTVATYNEKEFDKKMQELSASPDENGQESDSDESEFDSDNDVDLNWEGNYTIQNPTLKKIMQTDKSASVQRERTRWGGNEDCQWSLEKAEMVVETLLLHGYGNLPAKDMVQKAKGECARFPPSDEVIRMMWSLPLVAFREEVMARASRKGSKGPDADADDEAGDNAEGKVSSDQAGPEGVEPDDLYKKLWHDNKAWLDKVVKDALEYARNKTPRSSMDVQTYLRSLSPNSSEKPSDKTPKIVNAFEQSIWPSLRSRGWEEIENKTGDESSDEEVQKRQPWRKRYGHLGTTFESVYTVLDAALVRHPELAMAIETTISSLEVVEKCDAGRDGGGDVEITDEKDFLQSSLTALTSFLAKYAPLQLMFDRSRSRTLKVTRKLLSILSLMEKANRLVKLASEKGGREGITENSRLAELITLSKRCLLPHPSWSSTQDVALIRAIVKHGWIDHPRQRTKIAGDSSLQWGAPFDGKSQEVPQPQEQTSEWLQERKFEELKAAAERARKRLNDDKEWLQEIKGFDIHNVAKMLCLFTRGKDGYVVDEAALRKQLDERSKRLNPTGATDGIPTGKELVKRATLLIFSKASQASDETRESRDGTQPTNDDPTGQGSTQFGVLDQSEPCNVLLLEILRTVLKGNKTTCIRRLLKDGEEEAKARSRDRSTIEGGEKAAGELQKIAEGVNLCGVHLKASPRQSKNVIRAILGKNLSSSKNAESAFPSAHAPPVSTTTKAVSKSNRKDNGNGPNVGDDSQSGVVGRDYSYAEEAINSALTAQQQREKGKLPKSGESTNDLQLTFSEVLILSVISSQGVPVWSEDWQELLDSDPDDPVDAVSLSWHTMGDVVERAAKRWYLIARRRLNDTAKQLAAARNTKSEKHIQRLEVDHKVLNAEVETKREVVLHARELFEHPERLARTSVMLMEAVRRRMGPVNLNGAVGLKKAKQINKSENGLGPRVLQWYAKELSRWLGSLGVSQSDQLTELSGPGSGNDKKIVVACALKKSACRTVFGQVSQLVRLRCIFQRNEGDAARTEKLSKAVRNSTNNEDVWEGRPSWWGSSRGDNATDDGNLLVAVLESGFCGLSQALEEQFKGRSEKPSDTSRAKLQPRVNHLTRELHIVEETAENIRMLKRRSLNKKTPGSGEKASADGGSKMPGGAIQTGLHSFFSSQGTKSQTDENDSSRMSPVDLTGSEKKSSDDDDDDVVEVVETPEPNPSEKKFGKFKVAEHGI